MDIGDRMKLYEQMEAGRFLMPNLPALVRIDGRCFHSWTRGLERPFDRKLQELFDEVTRLLIIESNAVIGYTQSDEITLLLYNYAQPKSQIIFDGNIAKLCSVFASLATGYFNNLVPDYLPAKRGQIAAFDARAWSVPSEAEAVNCLLWREMDATRNSIESAARALYSHNQLHQKNTSEMQEMMFEKGINWNDYPIRFKRGGYFRKRVIERLYTADEVDMLPPLHEARHNPELTIKRAVCDQLTLPPLLKITNRVDVIFREAEPIMENNETTSRI